jgi:hypothetical protein
MYGPSGVLGGWPVASSTPMLILAFAIALSHRRVHAKGNAVASAMVAVPDVERSPKTPQVP